MMKITGLSHLFKWENLHNWWLTKYVFAPLVSKEVESQTGVTISRHTIRRTLQRNGMHGCRPRKKPLLKPRHKKAHLEFSRAHADKDEDYWDSILWSDETKINVFGTDGFKTVWRHKGEEYKEKCMVPTVKRKPMVVAVSLCGAA